MAPESGSNRPNPRSGPRSSPLRDPIIGTRTLHESRAYDVEELEIERPSGVQSKAIIRHRGAVVIVPLLEQPGRSPKFVMVRNDRHALNAQLEEFPAGGIDAGEGPLEAAARELREETGYEATSIYPIGTFYTTPGMTDELMHAYAATGLRQVGQDLEEDESLEVVTRTMADLESMIERGELKDGKTILALLWAERSGLLR
ncbi:MAG: NUDIX hydrolase [Planctomycetota bacterium]